jgi:hypothetical protein
MYAVTTTRFTQQTWQENKAYRESHSRQGCVYGTPKRMARTIPLGAPVFILEMNNTRRRIEGVGYVRNEVCARRCVVYRMGNYNRYTYKGPCRVDRTMLKGREEIVFRVLEAIVFGTHRLLMFGQGITRLPRWVQANRQLQLVDLLHAAFVARFPDAPIGLSPSQVRAAQFQAERELAADADHGAHE